MSISATCYTLTVLRLLGLVQGSVYEERRSFLWPNCIVKYTYEAGFLDNNRSLGYTLTRIMSYIEHFSAVRFVMWREGDAGDYVTFDSRYHPPVKCGHNNGTYAINVLQEGSTMLHILRSLLYVLGFLEEQNAHNRELYFEADDFVNDIISGRRTDPECLYFYLRCPYYPPVSEMVPKYESVMFYIDHPCNLSPGGALITPRLPPENGNLIIREPAGPDYEKLKKLKRNHTHIDDTDILFEIERIELLYPLTECAKERLNKKNDPV